MAAVTRRFVELGVAVPLAKELTTQINSGVGNKRRLIELGIPPIAAGLIVAGIGSGTLNRGKLAEAGIIPRVAKEIMASLGGGTTSLGPTSFVVSPATATVIPITGLQPGETVASVVGAGASVNSTTTILINTSANGSYVVNTSAGRSLTINLTVGVVSNPSLASLGTRPLLAALGASRYRQGSGVGLSGRQIFSYNMSFIAKAKQLSPRFEYICWDDGASFTGSISGTTLTVTAITYGTIKKGALLALGNGNAGALTSNTVITTQLSGPAGGLGTYTVNNSQTLASGLVSASNSGFSNFEMNGMCFANDGEGFPEMTNHVLRAIASSAKIIFNNSATAGIQTGVNAASYSTPFQAIANQELAGGKYVINDNLWERGTDVGGPWGPDTAERALVTPINSSMAAFEAARNIPLVDFRSIMTETVGGNVVPKQGAGAVVRYRPDSTHESPAGGYLMAKALNAALAGLPAFTLPDPTLAGNLATSPNFSGAVTVTGTNMSGSLGTGYTASRVGGTSLSVATFSKVTHAPLNTAEFGSAALDWQRVSINPTAMGGATFVGKINGAEFTASISGTVMTVTAVASGALVTGGELVAVGAINGTKVASQASGAAGGIGTYNVTASQTVASTAFIQAGTSLTVSSLTTGALAVGQALGGIGVNTSAKIVSGSGNNWVIDVAMPIVAGSTITTGTVEGIVITQTAAPALVAGNWYVATMLVERNGHPNIHGIPMKLSDGGITANQVSSFTMQPVNSGGSPTYNADNASMAEYNEANTEWYQSYPFQAKANGGAWQIEVDVGNSTATAVVDFTSLRIVQAADPNLLMYDASTTAPTFSSPATYTVDENLVLSGQIVTNKGALYSVTGADASSVVLNQDTGAWTFGPKDADNPGTAGNSGSAAGTNVYSVTFTATPFNPNASVGTQNLTITVNDVDDGFTPNFTAANGTDLSTLGFTRIDGNAGALFINSNAVRQKGSTDTSDAFYAAPQQGVSPNQSVKVTVPGSSGTGYVVHRGLNKDNFLGVVFAGNVPILYKKVAGTRTEITPRAVPYKTFASGDVLEMNQPQGSNTLTMYQNDVAIGSMDVSGIFDGTGTGGQAGTAVLSGLDNNILTGVAQFVNAWNNRLGYNKVGKVGLKAITATPTTGAAGDVDLSLINKTAGSLVSIVSTTGSFTGTITADGDFIRLRGIVAASTTVITITVAENLDGAVNTGRQSTFTYTIA